MVQYSTVQHTSLLHIRIHYKTKQNSTVTVTELKKKHYSYISVQYSEVKYNEVKCSTIKYNSVNSTLKDRLQYLNIKLQLVTR